MSTLTDAARSDYHRDTCRILQLLPNDQADPWLDVYSCVNLDDRASKRLRVGLLRPDFIGMVRIHRQYFQRSDGRRVYKTNESIFRGICGVNAIAPDDVRCSCEDDNYVGLKRASVPIVWWLRDKYAAAAEDMFDLATPCNSPRLADQTLPVCVEHTITGQRGLLVRLPADAGYAPWLLHGEVRWDTHGADPVIGMALLSELRVPGGPALQQLLTY